MLQVFQHQNARGILEFMQSKGLTLDDVVGPCLDSSMHLCIWWDDGTPPDIDYTIGAGGTSSGTTAGAAPNFAEVGELRTDVAAEVLGAVASPFAGAVASPLVIPGTLMLTVTGTGQQFYDDGLGNLIDKTGGRGRKAGTVNYVTGAVAINFGIRDNPSGNVTADYSSSTRPDITDMPLTVKLGGIALSGWTPATALTVKIYEDEAQTLLRWSGGGNTDANGDLYLDVGIISRNAEVADLTKRGKRWVLVGGDDLTAGEVSLAWERFGH